MATDIESKLLAAASAYAPLTALLGTSPFRWYSVQLQQASAFPAIVTLIVSNPPGYNITQRTSRSWTRVQFTCWAGSRVDAINLAGVLADFLDTFNGCGITGLTGNPSIIVAQRSSLYAQTQPPKYLEIVDAQILNDTNIA